MKKKELGAKFYWMEQAVVARLAKFEDIRIIKGYIPQLNQDVLYNLINLCIETETSCSTADTLFIKKAYQFSLLKVPRTYVCKKLPNR